MSTIPKPVLRNWVPARAKRTAVGMVIFSTFTMMSWKLLYMDPKHRKIEEFFRTYNPLDHIDAMCESGYMQSCGPNMVKQR